MGSWSPVSAGGTLHCQSGHTSVRGVFQQTTRYLIKVKWSFMLFLFWSCWCMPALSCREYCNHWYSTQKITFRYPWHASCEVNWTIPTSCEEFKTKIINQMNAWEVTLGWPVSDHISVQSSEEQKKYWEIKSWALLILFICSTTIFLFILNFNYYKGRRTLSSSKWGLP